MMMGGAALFTRLLENCFCWLPRADVSRPVQGNLFPSSFVTLGSHTTTQIPCKREFQLSTFFRGVFTDLPLCRFHNALMPS